MEISPEKKQSIKASLSLFMNEAEVEQFMNLSYAIDLIKQRQPSWQALVSIGVHTAELYKQGADIEKAILQELVGQALGPLEALLESLVLELGEEPPENERSRMLFHTRFALGFLLLANGENQRAKAILHEMAATKLSVRGIEVRSGPGIVTYTADMATDKWQSALYLLSEYGPQEDYGELLYHITEAAACNSWDTVMVSLAPAFLDHWAAKCEREDATKAFYFPTPEWLDLFAEAAEILSVCQEADSEEALPSECKRESAQFLAWKFGQIVGRFALPDNRWHDDPFRNLWQFSAAVEDESFQLQRGQEKTYQALKVVLSLLCEHDSSRDSNEVRKRYVSMWKSSYSYRGMPFDDIGPGTDLYWAMRIGFVDMILQLTNHPPLVREPASILETVVTGTGLRTAKMLHLIEQVIPQLQRMEQRLPPNQQEVLAFLEQQLCSVWHELPSDIVDELVESEQVYQIGTRTRSATISFAQAVEACFRYYFVSPLIRYMREEVPGDMTLLVGPIGRARPIRVGIRSSQESGVWGPGYLSLQQWAGLFEMLGALDQKGTANLSIKMFIRQKWPKLNLADLNGLIQPLKEVR